MVAGGGGNRDNRERRRETEKLLYLYYEWADRVYVTTSGDYSGVHIRRRGYQSSDFGISTALTTVGRVEAALAKLNAWELEVLELRYRWQYPVWLCIRELRRSWSKGGGPMGRRQITLSRTRYYGILNTVLDRVAALMWAEG